MNRRVARGPVGTVLAGLLALFGIILFWIVSTVLSIAIPVVIVVLILRAMGVL